MEQKLPILPAHTSIEKFDDAKGVITIRKPKDRQHNDQTKTDKRTNHDLQNTTEKTKDGTTRTPTKNRG